MRPRVRRENGMTSSTAKTRAEQPAGRSDDLAVRDLIERARCAQDAFGRYRQDEVDEVVAAVGWAGYRDAELLARLAVEETGIGNVDDKRSKNRRKIAGTMRDLKGAPSVGVIRVDHRRGITEIAKPAGIVAAFTP